MIEVILDRCLADIQAGRATVADCLSQYSQYADELKPLLEIAVAILDIPDVQPSQRFKRATRDRMLRNPTPSNPDGKTGESPVSDSKPNSDCQDRDSFTKNSSRQTLSSTALPK